MKARRKALSLILLSVLITSGCIHKAGGGNVTPYEQAVTYNTMLAQVNNSMAQGVIAVEQQALMPAATANQILTLQKLVADDHEKLTKILGAGQQSATDQADAITRLLAEMRIQAGLLINSGGLGLKNPKSKQTFERDVNSLLDLLTSLAASLHSAGVLKQ